jgi:CheY-like chemotaxis protein
MRVRVPNRVYGVSRLSISDPIVTPIPADYAAAAALEAGSNAYLTKPMRLEELREVADLVTERE